MPATNRRLHRHLRNAWVLPRLESKICIRSCVYFSFSQNRWVGLSYIQFETIVINPKMVQARRDGAACKLAPPKPKKVRHPSRIVVDANNAIMGQTTGRQMGLSCHEASVRISSSSPFLEGSEDSVSWGHGGDSNKASFILYLFTHHAKVYRKNRGSPMYSLDIWLHGGSYCPYSSSRWLHGRNVLICHCRERKTKNLRRWFFMGLLGPKRRRKEGH